MFKVVPYINTSFIKLMYPYHRSQVPFVKSKAIVDVIIVNLLLTMTSFANGHRIHQANFAPEIDGQFVSGTGSGSSGFHQRNSIVAQEFNPSREQMKRSDKLGFQYLTEASSRQPIDVATEFVKNKFGLMDVDLKRTNAYTDDHNGATHVYFKQVVNGLEVENADVNVNNDRIGRVVSFG